MKKILSLSLFNKLSILDYLVVFAIIFALGVGLVHFSREKSEIYVYTVNEFPEWQENPFPPLYWISNSINIGDLAHDSTGKKIAEVISIDNSEWGGQRRYSRLKLKVYGLFDKRTRLHRVGDLVLQVGNTLELDIGNTKYEGVITYVGETLEPPGNQIRYLEAEIKAKDVPPWLADTYNESFIVKNTQGVEIFKIIDSVIVPAEKSVETAAGTIVRSRDPHFKDVYFTAILRVRCQERVCYYNEVFPIKVGQWIWTQSETSIIEGSARIISVNELTDEIKK